LVEGVLNASIGPVTSETLRQYRLSVDVQAAENTIPALIEAIVGRACAPLPSVDAYRFSGSK
jgi:uroporphyrinogen-III synthase